jgi:hypothetical protein
MLRRVVWYKFTDVSEVLPASIIRAMMESSSGLFNPERTRTIDRVRRVEHDNTSEDKNICYVPRLNKLQATIF